MRILLAQNSLYYPAHGGGDKSNRLLMEALAARGHACRVVARIPVFGPAEQAHYEADLAAHGAAPVSSGPGVVGFERGGVNVRVVTNAGLRAYFDQQVEEFHPEVILTSTDDPAQLLLEAALASTARVVYLARATLALPFGPDCAFPSQSKAARLRAVDTVAGVSEYVARYVREHGGIDAVHVPISLMEPAEWPCLGRFDNEFVLMVNPCAVKGIAIFLALADAFPETAFAAVPMWGTNREDRAALEARPNVRLLDPVDRIETLLARTRVLLVPSLWAEARSRIVPEAMLHGIPVLAADVGGIPEAKLGVSYLLPINPIVHYQPRVDEQMVPVAEAPPQNIAPWREALARLLRDRAHYDEIALASRAAAMKYARSLSVAPFEALLEAALLRPKRSGRSGQAGESACPTFMRSPLQGGAGGPRGSPACHLPTSSQPLERLSPDKRRLLAVRLRQRAPAAAWFPGADAARGMRLFCFPYAGGGAGAYANWRLATPSATICPVRLPGRESRSAEAPFDRMAPLAEALAAAIQPYLDLPFAFFGHSMGAAAAFELARRLRRLGLPQPKMLIASAARAPQFRRNYTPPTAPSEAQFLEELRRLEGIPAEALDNPLLLAAILPALQADSALYRNYVYAEDEPFAFPVRAYGGAEDANVSSVHLAAWAQQTRASFAVRLFPGGHFFLHSGRADVLAAVTADLEQA